MTKADRAWAKVAKELENHDWHEVAAYIKEMRKCLQLKYLMKFIKKRKEILEKMPEDYE